MVPTTRRLVLFASGDFACNLYWQSLSFFLLFFYTDVAGLSPGAAGLVLLVGSVWDGIAAIAIGIWAQRRADLQRFVLIGAAPLGVAFVALYATPAIVGKALFSIVLAAHLAFRTLYALVNIPFAALTASVSSDSAARSRIAAYRMLYGTAAVIVVALVTRSASLTARGTITGAAGYQLTAVGFAIVATAVLVIVALTTAAPPVTAPTEQRRPPLARALGVLMTNRAFLTLNLAAGFATVAAGVLNGALLYYFTYAEHDAAAGPAAMAWMGIAGAGAIPVWMVVRGRIGTRGLWFADVALALAALAVFALAGRQGVVATQAFMFVMQVAMIGFSFAFWAMLPDTIEWGEHLSGERLTGLTFGAAALGQKIALGLANGLLGLLLGFAGHRAGGGGDPDRMAQAIRIVMITAPAVAIALSAAVMAANPLRRDTHARIVEALGLHGSAD